MSTERSFWKWLRGYTPPGLYTRIESPISPGVPDVYFNTGGYRGWIELKSISAPKRSYAKPLSRRGLNEDQISWISAEMRNLGNVWIFVKMGRIVYIYTGHVAEQINDWTFEQLRGKALMSISLGDATWKKQTDLKMVLLSDSSRSLKFGSPSNPLVTGAYRLLTSRRSSIKKKP